jgi:hypothetical protein
MQTARSNLVPTDTRTTRDARPARRDLIHPVLADDRLCGRPPTSFRLAAIG